MYLDTIHTVQALIIECWDLFSWCVITFVARLLSWDTFQCEYSWVANNFRICGRGRAFPAEALGGNTVELWRVYHNQT